MHLYFGRTTDAIIATTIVTIIIAACSCSAKVIFRRFEVVKQLSSTVDHYAQRYLDPDSCGLGLRSSVVKSLGEKIGAYC